MNNGCRPEKGALCPVQVPAGHIRGGPAERRENVRIGIDRFAWAR